MQAMWSDRTLAIAAAVMSIVCLMRGHHFSQWEMHLPLLHCKKRGIYHHYDDEIQAKIAKY